MLLYSALTFTAIAANIYTWATSLISSIMEDWAKATLQNPVAFQLDHSPGKHLKALKVNNKQEEDEPLSSPGA